MKYLQFEEALANLQVGVAIEQWIKADIGKDYTIIEWVRIDKEKDGSFSTAFFQSFDEGDLNFLDIYEFSQLEPDLPFGLISSFDNEKKAVEYCINTYSCRKDKFIINGIIQEEYRSFLLQKG